MFLWICFLMGNQVLYAQNAHAILGKWKNLDEGKAMQREIYLAQDGKYFGKVINDNNQASQNGNQYYRNLIGQ